MGTPPEPLKMSDFRNEADLDAQLVEVHDPAAGFSIANACLGDSASFVQRRPLRRHAGLDSELRADSNGLVARILVAESTSLRVSVPSLIDHLTALTDVNRCQRGFGWFERDPIDGHLYLTRRFASVDTDFAHVLIGLRLLVRAAKRWADYVTQRSLEATA